MRRVQRPYLHFLALSASFYSETQKLLLFRVIVGCANHLNYYKVSPPFTIPDSLPPLSNATFVSTFARNYYIWRPTLVGMRDQRWQRPQVRGTLSPSFSGKCIIVLSHHNTGRESLGMNRCGACDFGEKGPALYSLPATYMVPFMVKHYKVACAWHPTLHLESDGPG